MESTSELDTQKKVTIQEDFTSVLSQLNGLKLYCSSVINQVKSLEKKVKKQMKQHARDVKKMELKQRKKKTCVAAVPIKVSDTLIDFMGLTEGQRVARTEVTKFIINYIKTNSLQNPDNSQCIVPDKKLKTLFGCKDDNVEESLKITYFNIQKHMNKHFI